MNKNKSILIVDSDSEWLGILSDLLTHRTGQKPLSSPNGEEAYRVLKKIKVDIVFTNTNLGKMNGIELLKTIKSEFPAIKVVVFFEKLLGSVLTREELRNLGVDFVLIKCDSVPWLLKGGKEIFES